MRGISTEPSMTELPPGTPERCTFVLAGQHGAPCGERGVISMVWQGQPAVVFCATHRALVTRAEAVRR